MSTGTPRVSSKQNDTLLWLAGALVAGVGITWLVISSPWSSSGGETPAAAREAAAPQPAASTGSAATSPAGTAAAQVEGEARPETAQAGASATLDTSLDDNPLRMAELAYQAGMLVEPEEYSAWALYRRVLAKEPSNAEAQQGLRKIADELLRRANAAIEQGRYADARKTLNRIHEALPGYAGAGALAERLDKLAPLQVKTEPSGNQPTQAESSSARRKAKTQKAEPQPAKTAEPKVDRVKEAHDAFVAALGANRLLTPADSSAKHYLAVLQELAPDGKPTQEARTALFNKLLVRADESLADNDSDAAKTWIDEADALGVNAGLVASTRRRVADQLVAREEARRVPTSALKVVSYAPPEYPQLALARGVSGWVDVEFTVARDGTTRDIVVTDAQNAGFFKDPAIKAVSQWRFEPRVFMNRTIEQRSYTRIKFNFKPN
ncbi:MAG TPA: TonB family protein [Gammaproteobacteria bacterium]|nr:TonB family protein [Gammaproteobacteria bacterium]